MTNSASTSSSGVAACPDQPLAHVVDPLVLVAVFSALIVLTVVTVAVSYFDFGAMNLLVAMGVATIKAALVALWFMHLRYDSPFYAFLFLVAVVFLGLFLSITMLDSVQYHPEVEAWQQQIAR
jgi:cytochrome c oxidase subunit IV